MNPIDLDHLARQTLGDTDLQREVLQMFLEQAQNACERLSSADEAERRMLAHTLKGSARGVGAFPIADCAEAIERRAPSSRDREELAVLVDELGKAVDAIRDVGDHRS
ncbi:Hpt domain-containing protein [Mesorhizobium sp. CAU 1732]|uniref:Hpt domain-containing protein n=1 Tax=Mesorhizobium sp. CAU 1732 TaxID=3140358 RepID=UPI003260FECC